MTPIGRALFAILLAASTSACDSAVTNFVRDAKPPVADLPSLPGDPVVTEGSSNGVKVSPGRLVATSADLQLEATVTVTRRRLTAPDLGAEISIQRAPLDP